MLRYLFLLFVLLPLADFVLLIRVAELIGVLEAVLLVIITGLVGASMIQREGFTVLQRLNSSVYVDEAGQAMLEGALLVAGGVFLLSPGIITDLIGFAFVSSWTRQTLAARLRNRFQNTVNVEVRVFGDRTF